MFGSVLPMITVLESDRIGVVLSSIIRSLPKRAIQKRSTTLVFSITMASPSERTMD